MGNENKIQVKNDLLVIILAAGKGTRMNSSLPKVMHKIAGKPMISYVLEVAMQLLPKSIKIVVSEDYNEIRKATESLGDNIDYVVQKDRLGTGHAARVALDTEKGFNGTVLVLNGDAPLIRLETLVQVVEKTKYLPLCLAAFNCAAPHQYGKLVVEDDEIVKIVEHTEADYHVIEESPCNSGVIAFDATKYRALLENLSMNPKKNEYYITDLVELGRKTGYNSGYIEASILDLLGVNTLEDLEKAEKQVQSRLRTLHMSNGVKLIDKDQVYFSYDTIVAPGAVIYPYVFFDTAVVIQEKCEIHSFCHLKGVVIQQGARVGPFARIRPDSVIGEGVEIGNFVEIRHSQLDTDVKAKHLSYIGNATIGKSTNIGAGTIFCNYNGFEKSHTHIGNDVFIGSNSAIIAPVNIAEGSIIAAGSVITDDVEANTLAVARAKQVNLNGKAQKFKNKFKGNKNES